MKLMAGALCALLAFPVAATAATDAEIQQGYEQSIAARGAKRPDIAESILRQLIEERPNAGQLRFDLGVALAEQGRCAAAARAFNNGKRLIHTPSFDRAVDVAMDDLCPAIAPFDINLGFNFVYDTNANGGAGDSTIDVDGVPLLLSGDAVAKEAYGYQFSGSFAYNARVSATNYIVPSMGFAITDYQGSNLDSYSLTPGLAFRHKGDRIDWRAGPLAVLTYDQDHLDSSGVGVSARASVVLGPRTGLYLNASYLDISDKDNSLQDYTQSSVSATVVHNPTDTKINLRAGVTYTDRDYEDDYSDISSLRLSLGVSGSLTNSIGYDLSYSHAKSEGSTTHYILGDREDNVDTISARVSFADYEGWYGRPYLGVSHSVSDSTWGTKTYDRTRVLVGFTRSF
jgi:hypothetical protein